MDLQDRVDNYNREFPDWPEMWADKGWLMGVWMIGQNFRAKHGYYGEYPPNYLKRVHALFPDAKHVLHLFCGMVEKGRWSEEATLDCNPDVDPDIVADVEESDWLDALDFCTDHPFDLILADPPYTGEDAAHYGTPLINRNQVVKDCAELVREGGHLVWLDQVYPIYRKAVWSPIGTIGVWRSTNHRFRGVTIWKRTGEDYD